MSIEFIFFDLGNVLLTFDHQRAVKRLAELSGIPPQTFHAVIFESGLQTDYETGALDDFTFATRIREQTQCRLEPEQILYACSDIFRLNTQIVPVIASLHRTGQRIGILSNTCAAHWRFLQSRQFPLLRDYFPVSILSYESRSMKPDRKIFDDAREKAGVDASNIFFTDDREENVAGAIEAGFDATQFRSIAGLIKDLTQRNVRLSI